MEKLKAEKESASKLQERKHEDWNDNYELYRNKVKTNRLTQRQAVNIPLMKETLKTLLSSIDDAPNIEWSERSGDEEKELIYQEIWNAGYKDNKFELQDILEKKSVLLYGFAIKQLNIVKDGVTIKVLDPYDVLFDSLMEPSDIETARFVIVRNIFRSLRDILADERYTGEGKSKLKIWIDSPRGITQSGENREDWQKKMERLEAMGVDHGDFDLFAGGDRIVNLTQHCTNVWNPKVKEFERRVVTYADDEIELLNESLEEQIGVDFWPFIFWSEDPEGADVYPDSVADLIRPINKVLNVWFSQLIENRTLKNFQMHWFLPGQNYTPQTYQPGPGVMLPAPPGDDIRKTIMPVEISGLDDTLGAINAITQIAERGSGATAISKGEPESGTQTLGEVQILVGKAQERTVGMAKFYRLAWYETCWKWDKMMHANAPRFLKLYKQASSGKTYMKRVYSADWKSEAGYEPIVRSTSEQENEETKGIQKFIFILSQFPNNQALRKIAQKRMLEVVNLTPEELRQVEEAEVATANATPEMPGAAVPQEAGLQADVQNQLKELEALHAT